MLISMIVAHDENRLIGKGNALPWHIQKDLQHFKKMTVGKTVIMGRKTFESIGRPLPDRVNIVLSRQSDYNPIGTTCVITLENALLMAETKEVVIIGGQQIYEQAMQYADRLYITKIDHVFEGDAYFPSYDDWQLVSESEPISAGEYNYRYCIYERVN